MSEHCVPFLVIAQQKPCHTALGSLPLHTRTPFGLVIFADSSGTPRWAGSGKGTGASETVRETWARALLLPYVMNLVTLTRGLFFFSVKWK